MPIKFLSIFGLGVLYFITMFILASGFHTLSDYLRETVEAIDTSAMYIIGTIILIGLFLVLVFSIGAATNFITYFLTHVWIVK